MALFSRRRKTEFPPPSFSTLEAANKAYEQSEQELAQAIHEAVKNVESAREVKSQRLRNHLGPAFALALEHRR